MWRGIEHGKIANSRIIILTCYFQVPDVLEDYTIAILRVQAKRMFAPQVEFEVVDDKKIEIKKLGTDTFIQTDKPIYKPGQTGKKLVTYIIL